MDLLQPVAGGLLIGSAAVLLYVALGRIAGISGITYGLLLDPATGADRWWRLLFLGGLIAGGWLAVAGFGQGPAMPGAPTAGGIALLAAAGLLTGIGTRLGNGCTSGHGVCGVARLSPRSLVATVVFMGVGMAAATLLRPLLLS
ncbi:MAG: YeeE/YedE family protein [Pseudomonadota bacterium]